MRANFKITSGPAAFNGDLVGHASWTNAASGGTQSETTAEKVRNVSPVKINEFRIGSGAANSTDSFIELYNAGAREVDISNWSLTVHPIQQAIFSTVKVPAGTRLAARGFYLLGLSNSGLAVSARAGDAAIHVRSTNGLSVGDAISIDAGSNAETRKIVNAGTEVSNYTTLWQPLPDGPVIAIPAGSTSVPVTSTSGFKVGEKIALGYGATYPDVARGMEQYEVATVTVVGRPGTQAYLAADAPAGSTNIKVTDDSGISVGDKIRLDIDNLGHGIETVTVTKVGTQATRTNLSANAAAGSTNIKVRMPRGFVVGDQIVIGTIANHETVTATSVGRPGPGSAGIEFTPALAQAHIRDEEVIAPGSGVDIAAPLKFNHAANLPFSDQGTGISFQPATAFVHSSNEPVQALGAGITLDRPLTKDHAIDAVVLDSVVKSAGYQGTPEPNQWFGGPELTAHVPFFGRIIPVAQGSMVLRDAAGLVVDSLNFGGLVDPWAAEGYQAASGSEQSGCYAPAPGVAPFPGPFAGGATNASAGRFPDGVDSDSNCSDLLTQASAVLDAASSSGAKNIKVTNVEGFEVGEKIMIDTGANRETAVIATVGTAGATTASAATGAGATEIPVATAVGFRDGQAITIDSGANSETAVIAAIRRFGAATLTVTTPLKHAHPAGAQVSGTGITLSAPLTREHAMGAQIADHDPTPGAPNQYHRRAR